MVRADLLAVAERLRDSQLGHERRTILLAKERELGQLVLALRNEVRRYDKVPSIDAETRIRIANRPKPPF